MINITFFNLASIGDIYFSVPFIRFVCEKNPQMTFYIHTNLGSYLYHDIPNLKQLDPQDLPFDHPERRKLYYFFHQYDRKLVTEYDDKTFFVNTWIGPFNEMTDPPLNCCCHPEDIYEAFQQVMGMLISRLPIDIHYPAMTKRDLIYRMPNINIDSFLEFKQKSGKDIVFYFNRMGASADSKPFSSEKDHIDVLTKLSSIFPEKLFLVPNEKLKPDCANVIATSHFGIHEDHTCKNVLEDIEIGGNCNYAFIFDMGSAFTFCNDKFASYTAKFYHLSKRDDYPKKLKKTIENCLEIPTSNIEYVYCTKPDEIVEIIKEKIKE